MKSLKKKLAGILAMTMLVGAAASAATTTASPAKKAEPKAQTAVAVESVTVNTAADGTATIAKVDVKKKKVTVPTTVTVDGVEYTVTSIAKGAFKGLKKNAVVSINTKKSLKVAKKAFKGNTKKVTIKVNKKMSNKELKKFKKALKKAGFQGKVKKALK